MKMADLKAFVEMKLLSKSEKALEKIGQEENKALFTQVRKHNYFSSSFFPVDSYARKEDIKIYGSP